MSNMITSNQEENLTHLVESFKMELSPLFKKYNVSFAYFGGSWVRGKQSAFSDMDIFVSLPSLVTLSSEEIFVLLSDFSRKACEITKQDTLEITVLERIPLHVQFQAIKDGILLYEENKDIRINFIENLLKYYYDHKIWYHNYLSQAVEG
ncbi:MAG: nucleotidyltransferase domain-containing protein [Candidatus Heimdallarchaeota archaeon]|nr:nucleotidyltransferase domain-containing protein [Candidatus Heimdallarchaeota archaeon]